MEYSSIRWFLDQNLYTTQALLFCKHTNLFKIQVFYFKIDFQKLGYKKLLFWQFLYFSAPFCQIICKLYIQFQDLLLAMPIDRLRAMPVDKILSFRRNPDPQQLERQQTDGMEDIPRFLPSQLLKDEENGKDGSRRMPDSDSINSEDAIRLPPPRRSPVSMRNLQRELVLTQSMYECPESHGGCCHRLHALRHDSPISSSE